MNPAAKFTTVTYPQAFDSQYIRVHWEFENDLKDILERSGQQQNFRQKIRQRLRHLDERRRDCVRKTDWFEKLKHEKDLYSMKIKGGKNIRILFAFAAYRGSEYAILLYPFEEKDNKNRSQWGYDTAKPIAQKRLEEVLRDV